MFFCKVCVCVLNSKGDLCCTRNMKFNKNHSEVQMYYADKHNCQLRFRCTFCAQNTQQAYTAVPLATTNNCARTLTTSMQN